jgi:hypothetical protein
VNPENWQERHKQFRSALDTDQVEAQAMLAGAANIDIGIEDERMAGIVDDALIENGNSWEERQVVLENLSGAIAEEVERRSRMMKDAYPFEMTKAGALSHRPSQTGVYEFCLAAALNPTGESPGAPKSSAIFEMIARDVLASYLGSETRGFRAGAPSYDFEKRGSSARETFLALEKQCGEIRWCPEAGFPDEPTFKHLRDAGLDVVVWKPWSDGRLGQLFALGQCACGKNDVDASKGRELSPGRLGIWLRPICHAPPLRCFFVAHHIPNTLELYAICKDAGVVFDRARMALVAESAADRVKSREGIDYHYMAQVYANPRFAQPVLAQPRQTRAAAPRSQSHGIVPPPT